MGNKEAFETVSVQPSEPDPLISSNITSSSQYNSEENYRYKYNEDGRRYHGDEMVAYLLPNDDDETGRLHKQHLVLRYVLQRNYDAPITKMLEEGITVLDSGCGPAAWTLDMAVTFPKSKFHGVDISSVFPDSMKPDNVEFLVGNVAQTLPYPDNTFDYIHQRLLMAGLTSEDWSNALKELYRILKPGGYIELAEFSVHDFVNMGEDWAKLQAATMGGFSLKGIPAKVSSELKDRLIKAGFVNEKLEITPLPINHDGKRGELVWNDLKHAYINLRPAFAKSCLEWEDVDVYAAHVEACGLEARKNKTCINWYACYAQKPFE